MRTSILALATALALLWDVPAFSQSGAVPASPPAPPSPPKLVNAQDLTEESSTLRCKLQVPDGRIGSLQLIISGGRAYPKSGVVNVTNRYVPHELDQSPKRIEIAQDELGVLQGVELLGSFNEMYEFWVPEEKRSRTYISLSYKNSIPVGPFYGIVRKGSLSIISIQHSSRPTFDGQEKETIAIGFCEAKHKAQLPLTSVETAALLAARRPKAKK